CRCPMTRSSSTRRKSDLSEPEASAKGAPPPFANTSGSDVPFVLRRSVRPPTFRSSQQPDAFALHLLAELGEVWRQVGRLLPRTARAAARPTAAAGPAAAAAAGPAAVVFLFFRRRQVRQEDVQ